MESIAQKEVKSQEQLEKLEQKDIEQYLKHIDPEEFWEDLSKRIREGIRITMEKAISYEFRQFIGALEYDEERVRKEEMSVMAIVLVILALSME